MSSAEPRRVLITNTAMTTASGTVTYTRDLALALLRQGWLPIVYTSRAGAQAAVLRAATIPVVTDLTNIGEAPDIIHGHHTLETLAALARFPNVPALFVCHDALSWHSIPPRSSRIRAFVAVDRNCRDRIVFEYGVRPESVQVLTNVVDLARFARRPPLPPRPRRALIFSNHATQSSFVEPIRDACAARGIEVDVVGVGAENAVDHPETILPQYDLVFAKARCAIEAAAVGCAVIVCDSRGIAGMITRERVEPMRQLNFGRRMLQLPVTAERVIQEIDLYDASEASAVTDNMRASSDSELIATQFISIYEDLLREPSTAESDHGMGLVLSLQQMAQHLYAQVEVGSDEYRVLRKLFYSRPLGPLLRLVLRLKRRGS